MTASTQEVLLEDAPQAAEQQPLTRILAWDDRTIWSGTDAELHASTSALEGTTGFKSIKCTGGVEGYGGLWLFKNSYSDSWPVVAAFHALNKVCDLKAAPPGLTARVVTPNSGYNVVLERRIKSLQEEDDEQERLLKKGRAGKPRKDVDTQDTVSARQGVFELLVHCFSREQSRAASRKATTMEAMFKLRGKKCLNHITLESFQRVALLCLISGHPGHMDDLIVTHSETTPGNSHRYTDQLDLRLCDAKRAFRERFWDKKYANTDELFWVRRKDLFEEYSRQPISQQLKWLVTVWEPEVIWREAYCKLRERERDMPEKDQLIAFINKLRNQVALKCYPLQQRNCRTRKMQQTHKRPWE
ncbi:hypothetical protein CYMTET_9482 [Cymbomonas tetramitiformis]|uniref:Uncharacterized protein n=1 Tax=Cymbomonas tetramitiformis TaxID=36881 RepID=A0AAE0GRD1_9CHLO|nr:hypothetical protein CYMTET_9482 [Cymbomonas tetramitiformis]